MNFKVGDRIKSEAHTFAPIATVTKLTERGFEYEYDEPWWVVPRWGWKILGGEVYTDIENTEQWSLVEDDNSQKNEPLL